jgi:hypothetical protein
MGRLFFIAVATLVLIVGCTAKAEVPVAVSDQGWTITASPELGTLSVSQERLGLVVQNVRLNLQGERGLSHLTGWSVLKSSQSSLTLHTVHPIGAWTFEIGSDGLKISNTFTRAVLSAEAPAPLNRMPARTLDPRALLSSGWEPTKPCSSMAARKQAVSLFSLRRTPKSCTLPWGWYRYPTFTRVSEPDLYPCTSASLRLTRWVGSKRR